MINTVYILILVLFCGKAQDQHETFVFETEDPNERHMIIFEKAAGSGKTYYFGSEDGKGHGVFFYSVELTDLKVGNDGTIEFQIGEPLEKPYGRNDFQRQSTPHGKIRRHGDRCQGTCQ